MIELRLGNVVAIGLSALLFFVIVKFLLRKTQFASYAEDF